jgi:hypothetical protein
MLDDPKTLRQLAEDLETDLRVTTAERNWFVNAACEMDETILRLDAKLKMHRMIVWCLVAAWILYLVLLVVVLMR